MKRVIVLLILLNVFQHRGFAQIKKKIDSLQTVLLNAKEDSVKVNALIAITNTYNSREMLADSAIVYGNKVIELSMKINFKLGISRGNRGIGLAYKNKAYYPKALKYFDAALKIDIEIGRKDREKEEYLNI